MTKIVFVLGPDRVGKSTLIKNLERISEHVLGIKNYASLHFSGPSPSDTTPIDQYVRIINPNLNKPLIICDRGGSEVCFYEKMRRHVDLPLNWAVAFENYLLEHFSIKEISILLLKREWKWCEEKHIEEIKQEAPNCTDFWVELNLVSRLKEHMEYYKFMSDYFEKTSLLKACVKEIDTNIFSKHELLRLLGV